jgi:hypothetical protein
MGVRKILAAAACSAPALVFLAVYVPAAGHGFISDDFAWILHNRLRSASDIWRIATQDNGFYRPAVAFSFALNELAFDLNPRAYGLINVALAVLCGVAVFHLGRALDQPRGASAFAACAWLLNLHGVNMAILWISGRTALLATAAAAACAAAVLRRRLVLAAAFLLLAVTSREDAIMLPVVTAVWWYVRAQDKRDKAMTWKWLFISAGVVAGYLIARSTTGAMTPATAPPYYQVTSSLAAIGRNAAEYGDRTMTTTAAALMFLAILVRPRLRFLDRRSAITVACGGLWLIAFVMPALLLPVRSSLYACLPSVGPCIAAAAIAERWWADATHAARRQVLAAAVVVPVALWPVYLARNARWVGMAEFSTAAIAELKSATAGLPDDSDILIVDDRTHRMSVASVFSTMLRDAFLVTSGRYMTFYVEPPVPYANEKSGDKNGCGGCEDLRFVVKDGRLKQDSR